MTSRVAAFLAGAALLAFAMTLLLEPSLETGGRDDSGRFDVPPMDSAERPNDTPSPLNVAATRVTETPSRQNLERTLRVVDVHGSPVEGATVRWGTHRPAFIKSGADRSWHWGAVGMGPDRRARAETDARGEIAVFHEDALIDVEIVRDALYARTRVSLDEDEPYEVAVTDAYALRLRTRERSGRPIGGIPLLLRERRGGARLWRGVTRLPEGGVICAIAGRHAGLEIVPDLPFEDLEALPVTEADLARGTLTYKLPPGAQLDIDFESPDGRPFKEPTLVWLRDADQHTWSTAQRSNGRWRHPWFPLSRRLRIDAVPADRRYGAVTLETMGPVRTARRTTVLVRFPSAGSARLGEDVVTVRLVGEDGAPVARADVDWNLERDERVSDEPVRWRPGTKKTDSNGVVALPYDAFVPPSEPVRIVFLARDDSRGTRSGHADVTGRLLPGGASLVDVVLRPAAIAAAGVVVDELGTPVANAHVRIRVDETELGAVPTDGEGHFELRHPSRAPTLTAHASATHFRPMTPLECPTGSREIRLVLERSAGVAGRVLLADSIDTDLLEVQVVQGRYRRTATLDEDGRFEVWGFAPGRCTFKVFAKGELASIIRILDIPLLPGELQADARLREVDMLGLVRAITLTIESSDGAPLPEADVMITGPGAAAVFRTDDLGRASFLRSKLPCRVEISKKIVGEDGSRRLTLEDVDESRTVVLAE